MSITIVLDLDWNVVAAAIAFFYVYPASRKQVRLDCVRHHIL